MKKRWALFLIIAMLVAASYFILPARRIMVVHPHYGPAVQAAYGTGTVEASVMMPIASRVTARLIELNVDEGAQVKKGQVLAQLDNEELQHNLKELQSREEFARKKYERSASLLKKGNVSINEYESDRSGWLAAQAAVSAAESKLTYLQLISPADGTIIRRDGEIGELIPANQTIFWLMCCAPLRVSTEIDEEDIANVKPGQQVLIRADAFPGQVFHGVVQQITPKGDPIARSYRVRVRFTQENPLKIGMTAETNIIFYENKHALLVPSSAVMNDKVWLVKNGRLKLLSVKTGAKGEEQVEIMSGLSVDDLIAVSPDEHFKENLPVQIQLQEAS
ncbi:membrane fusion protein [Legionella birminghamensis]|uniref:Membrane-fusion protein n=1 Tax=Legionella birminghamensis TaxID=28083 RepID=A0A378IM67_9GAMM|nr:efflux RND transporter periplasmic adaptor subunit [Legionella birminghamensis]KTC68864.1 membrane fusion protein [Legionella birminghamensis]STX33194.1 Membrane-fusion protein [Legionella birminghamensis]